MTIDHVAMYVNDLEKGEALTARLHADGGEVLSGPRTTGDGCCESCIVGIEGNQNELTA